MQLFQSTFFQFPFFRLIFIICLFLLHFVVDRGDSDHHCDACGHSIGIPSAGDNKEINAAETVFQSQRLFFLQQFLVFFVQDIEMTGVKDLLQSLMQSIILRKDLKVDIIKNGLILHPQNIDVVIVYDLR